MKYLNVIVYNGLCNRLLPIISSLRFIKMFESFADYKVNIIYTHTPVRSCLAYEGDFCKFADLFQPYDSLSINGHIEGQFTQNYEFKYWDCKEHIIQNPKPSDQNIEINYALYTIISENDPQPTIFSNLKATLAQSSEIILDSVGRDLQTVIKSLKPVPELQLEIDKFQKTFLKNMIGLHIRSSDGDFTKLNWKETSKTLIEKCKKWIQMDSNNNGVYLATDDLEIFIEFQLKLGSNLKFYEPPNILCGTASETKFKNDKFNVLTAVIELWSFSKCSKYIIGTCDSTFSLCGILLNDSTDCRYFLIKNSSDLSKIPDF